MNMPILMSLKMYMKKSREEKVEPPSLEFGNDNFYVEHESFSIGLTSMKV